ncbi:hypothetical protein QYM36_003511 [Artemia franciscana]|uniref:Ubiquitin-activating enzyme SCCH domain-containing protein n=1 Tax=Artemia franciscana TaxID=6661 RepID=A0AA88L8P9_ARTSF|nr:hypothetical protein QYM36_003511 [Artemia franciscana]
MIQECPHPLDFDSTNKTHLDFIISAANLKAVIYGLPPHRDPHLVKILVVSVEVPTFVPQSGVRIAGTDAEAQAANQGQTDISLLYFRLLSSALCIACNLLKYYIN